MQVGTAQVHTTFLGGVGAVAAASSCGTSRPGKCLPSRCAPRAAAGVPMQRSSTALSPQLRELLRQADCGSAEQATNRYRAAELVQNCLESTSVLTDPLRRLLVELQREITTLNQRVKQLEQRSNELESVRFSTTTKLRGVSTFILGANGFSQPSPAHLQHVGLMSSQRHCLHRNDY